MPEIDKATDGIDVKPWFTDHPIDVLIYRVNRRPRAQGNLFAEQPEAFIDHLAEVLLFGTQVSIGNRGNRKWQLGNRRIDPQERFVAGVIGWESPEVREEDYFDEARAEWIPTIEQASKVGLAPFVIEATTRRLYVARHTSFAETTISTVFRTLLNEGENTRPAPTTDWDVQPLLDERDFDDWLRSIAVLEKITFVAKLPNPDAEESFRELTEHLENMRAGEMRHSLKAADESEGLSKNLADDPLAHGLLEMSKRGYAAIAATARDSAAKVKHFTQRRRTRRDSIEISSADYNEARDELAAYSVDAAEPEDG